MLQKGASWDPGKHMEYIFFYSVRRSLNLPIYLSLYLCFYCHPPADEGTTERKIYKGCKVWTKPPLTRGVFKNNNKKYFFKIYLFCQTSLKVRLFTIYFF
jgi:hypothetical protein